MSPRAVLVSVGAGNRYRHPDPGLIGGLERAGAAVRRTDTAGDIALVGRPTGEDLQVVARGSPSLRRGEAGSTRTGAAERPPRDGALPRCRTRPRTWATRAFCRTES